MLKKVIKYVDYDDNPREETFYFNLTKVELAEMDVDTPGGLKKMIEKIVQEQDQKKILDLFKDLILRSYGEKSLDGKRFIKSKELSEGFSQTNAYVEMFMELGSSTEAAVAFVNGIIPNME